MMEKNFNNSVDEQMELCDKILKYLEQQKSLLHYLIEIDKQNVFINISQPI